MSELRDIQFARLVSQAYVEGFKEGLNESKKYEGGKLWTESESFKKLKVLEDDTHCPQEIASE